MGEVPGAIVLVETEADVDALEVDDPERIAYLTQTTLSVDETRAIIARLRERFPAITGPRTDDICYATTNRQLAVKQMAEQCDLVLVIGSQELVELQPARRRRPRPRRRVVPDRQRVRGPRGVARGRPRRRHLLRRERAGGARPAARRLLPRPRDARTCRPSRCCARTSASCCRRSSGSSWRAARVTAPRRRPLQPGAQLGAVLVELRRRPADRAGARRRSAAAARAAGSRPVSVTGSMPSDAASANASATSLIGPAGTAAARSAAIQLGRRPRGEARRSSRAASSSACATRAAVRGEALVGGQLGQPERLAQPREQAVVADGDGERPVGGVERLVRRDARVAVAAPVRHDAAEHPGRALVEQRQQRRVHQRHLDVAARAGPLALGERGLDADHREQPADEVDDGGARLERRRPPRR